MVHRFGGSSSRCGSLHKGKLKVLAAVVVLRFLELNEVVIATLDLREFFITNHLSVRLIFLSITTLIFISSEERALLLVNNILFDDICWIEVGVALPTTTGSSSSLVVDLEKLLVYLLER
jgi:hypothetical protein